MEQRYYDDLYKGHQLQEDVLGRLSSGGIVEESIPGWLAGQHFFQDKMPTKARLVKKGRFGGLVTESAEEDEGLSLEEFFKDRCVTHATPQAATTQEDTATVYTDMDAKEHRRLTDPKTGMFKKWAAVTNTSAIARFMKEGLDPRKEYSKKEMRSLCKEYGIRLAHIMKVGGQAVNTNYGILLAKHTVNNTFSLHPYLFDTFQQHF